MDSLITIRKLKEHKVIWQCNHKFDGGEKCSTPHLDKETIKGQLFDTGELEDEQSRLQEELNVVAELIQQCARENAHVALDQAEYQARYDGLAERFDWTAWSRSLMKTNGKAWLTLS